MGKESAAMAFAAFKADLEQLQLEQHLQEEFRKRRDVTMQKLQNSAEQLRQVGGDPNKLSVQQKLGRPLG